MTSFNPDSTGVQALTTRQCLVELNKLVPNSLSTINDQDKAVLQGKITLLLKQVISNGITPEQRVNITNIRELAQRAKGMHLLSEEGEAVLKGIAAKTKEIGISLLTAPRDFTLQATDGEVKVNLDVLKENSAYFKGMAEAIESMNEEDKRVAVPFSTKTVEFLMKCLHAPEAQRIVLTDDNIALVPDLLPFVAGFEFDTLIQKLEPSVTQFLEQKRDAVGESWLSALDIVRKTHPESAIKWFNVIMPHLLNNFDIPVKPSWVPGHFEIPIKLQNVFFDDQSREIMKYLPLVLEIKDDQDLDLFLKTCLSHKLETSIPIKLLCRLDVPADKEESIKMIAEASKVQLSIEKVVLPPGTTFFGKELWDKYLGQVDDVPLPSELIQLLDTEIILLNGEHTGKKWKDQFMLFLFPEKVGGQPLTMNRFRELVQHPQNDGHAVNYNYVYHPILQEHGNTAVERSAWVLLSKDVIEESRSLPYFQQLALVEAIPDCEVPDFLAAQVGIATHFIDTRERLYGQKPWTYTRCKETTLVENQRYQIAVGGFGAAGLVVNYYSPIGLPDCGVGALRKFVS